MVNIKQGNAINYYRYEYVCEIIYFDTWTNGVVQCIYKPTVRR